MLLGALRWLPPPPLPLPLPPMPTERAQQRQPGEPATTCWLPVLRLGIDQDVSIIASRMAWGPVRRLRRQGSLASAATRFAACLAGGSIATSTAKIINGSRTTLAHTTGRLQGSSGSGGCEYSGTAWGGASGGGHAKPPGSDDPAGHPPSRAQLVRDFIHDSLYHPLEGYFTRRSASGAGVVGSLQRPLDFTALEGQAQYLQAVREVYRQLQAAWLTPVEILQPHYGRAMVSCILQRWHQQAADAAAAGDSEPPLTIYEMGGGTGTLALNILDWLRAEHPAAYRRTRYRCVEISPVLAAIQRCRLAQGGHAERFAVRQHDAADLAAWRKADGAAGSSSGDGGSSSCGGGGDGGSGSGSGSGSSGSSSSGRASSCSNLSNGSNSSRLSDSGSSGGSSSCGGGGISGSGSGSGGGNAASSSNLSVSSNSSRLSDSGISSGGGGGGDEGVAGEHCFVVMCEVLDNLPHDRVQRSSGSGEWQQTLVAQRDPAREATGWTERRRGQDGPTLFEVLQPASDPLILRCLQAVQAAEGSSNGGGSGAGLAASAARMWRRLVGEAAEDVRWLPTGCLQLLDTLQQARPSHTLLAADFDQLPEVAVAGVNAPLVASTHGGRTHDHGSYLVPRGSADIFFPTDFALLCTLYQQAAAAAAVRRPSSSSGHLAVSAEHMPTPDFMWRHSPDLSATRTRSGYNPLLQDYSNTAVFVGSCQWVRACGGGGGSSGGGGGLH